MHGHMLRKEGKGGYHHQEDAKYTGAGKEKQREAQEKRARQHQGGHARIQDDTKHGTRSKCVAHGDKGRPLELRGGLCVRR